jgi:uncharacterized repeat protein (TIGR03803 family)
MFKCCATLLAATTLWISGATAQSATPVFQTLHTFAGPPGDGNGPSWIAVAGLPNGRTMLFGTTAYGGSSSACMSNCGTVFGLVSPGSPGGAWTEKVLWNFVPSPDGSYPQAGVLIGSGILYGTTSSGGLALRGSAFSLAPPVAAGGAWTETLLYSFGSVLYDAIGPNAPMSLGPGGVLYGTTSAGGSYNYGAVFSLTPPASSGGGWIENILYDFTSGAYPMMCGVVAGPRGVLYGTTETGGTANQGRVYSLTPPSSPGSAWRFADLYSFSGSNDGSNPWGPLAMGRNGALYGTTNSGGSGQFGTVFRLTPPAAPGGSWSEAVLYSFTRGPDGGQPTGGVAIGPGGVLYGTTTDGGGGHCFHGCGTVFSLSPPASPGGAWTLTVLHTFSGGADGTGADAGVTVGTAPDGHTILYGSTYAGGAGFGTVYSVEP